MVGMLLRLFPEVIVLHGCSTCLLLEPSDLFLQLTQLTVPRLAKIHN